jgi:hypothetical protein
MHYYNLKKTLTFSLLSLLSSSSFFFFSSLSCHCAAMAVGLSAVATPKPFRLFQHSLLQKPSRLFISLALRRSKIYKTRRKTCFTICVIMEDQNRNSPLDNLKVEDLGGMNSQIPSICVAERFARKRLERFLS